MSKLTLADYDHVERKGDFTPDASTPEAFIERLKETKPSITDIEILQQGGPITNLRVTDPENPYEPLITHRPDSVVVIPRIYRQRVEGTLIKRPHTILATAQYHFGGARVAPNFSAGGIDPGETVIDAAFREGSVEELPAIKPEYIHRATFLDSSDNSIGGLAERSYRVLLDIVLPPEMDVDELDGHVGGGDHHDADGNLTERETPIVGKIYPLNRRLLSVVAGTSDKAGIREALDQPHYTMEN